MTDSYISHGPSGVTGFSGIDGVRLFTAMTLRSGIGLLTKGIRPSRGWTMTGALARATTFTGRSYKRTEAQRAMADLTIWIDNMKLALPVIES